MNMVEAKIKKFEKGEKSDTLYYKHKRKEWYLVIVFNALGTERDVFVHDIREIVVTRDVRMPTGEVIGNGSKYLIEVYYETPTVYGHDLSFSELMTEIEKNYEVTKDRKSSILNEDEEWEYLEDFLNF